VTKLALQESLSDRVRDYLQTARESADLLLHLLNEVLDLSRIEAGRFELDGAPFSLRQTVEQVVRTLRVRADEKGLSLACVLADDFPNLLVGDPLRLQQVLMNLVGNALKFTSEGRVTVRAGVEGRAAGKTTLKFSIADTGIGIAPEYQERIFAPFTQADASTTRRYGGSGLGLTISRKLIEAMGGRLWVESQPGQGSVFHFTVSLPLASPSLAQRRGRFAGGGRTPAETPAAPVRALRVLLAEDTPANQKLVRFVLGDRGHTVVVAQNGREALERLAAEDFDVVLMDVQMPEMDGFQATAAIRALSNLAKAQLPIIAMTAHALKGDAERCLAAGMDAYLSKPIEGRDLIALVERLAGPVAGEGTARPVSGDSAQPSPPEASLSSSAVLVTIAEPSHSQPAVFDLAEAARKCFGKREVFEQMVARLFDEAGPLLAQMREALARGDGAELAASAHRLKNTVVYLAAGPVPDATRRVEQIGKSGDLTTAFQAIEELEQRLESLKTALAARRRPPGQPA
jgi:CheY-like chemotaxis protein